MCKFLNNKTLIIYISLFLIVLISAIVFFKRKNYLNRNIEFNVKKECFIENDGYNSIIIYFPQITGLSNKATEKKLNQLIEIDAKKMLQNNMPYNEKNFYFELDYENVFISENIVSVLYKGSYGAVLPGQGYYRLAFGTTIDIKNIEVVPLCDIVINTNTLFDWLLEGRFEKVSTWEGVKGSYPRDMDYYLEIIQDELKNNLHPESYYNSSPFLEWYTNGSDFVIIVSDGYYYEFSINIDEIKSIIKSGLL